MVDSPQLSVSSFTNGTATARVSLEPSNSAQTAAANAAILLPMRTRLTGSVTGSWARQNDPFSPADVERFAATRSELRSRQQLHAAESGRTGSDVDVYVLGHEPSGRAT